MTSDNKGRLRAILERKALADETLRAAQASEKLEVEEKEKKKAAARQLWPGAKKQLEDVIRNVNQQLKPVDLSLSLEEETVREAARPSIARVIIRLNEATRKDKQIIMNVNPFGSVQTLFFIDQSRKANDFSLEGANAEFLEGIIIEFLEQAVPSENS